MSEAKAQHLDIVAQFAAWNRGLYNRKSKGVVNLRRAKALRQYSVVEEALVQIRAVAICMEHRQTWERSEQGAISQIKFVEEERMEAQIRSQMHYHKPWNEAFPLQESLKTVPCKACRGDKGASFTDPDCMECLGVGHTFRHCTVHVEKSVHRWVEHIGHPDSDRQYMRREILPHLKTFHWIKLDALTPEALEEKGGEALPRVKQCLVYAHAQLEAWKESLPSEGESQRIEVEIGYFPLSVLVLQDGDDFVRVENLKLASFTGQPMSFPIKRDLRAALLYGGMMSAGLATIALVPLLGPWAYAACGGIAAGSLASWLQKREKAPELWLLLDDAEGTAFPLVQALVHGLSLRKARLLDPAYLELFEPNAEEKFRRQSLFLRLEWEGRRLDILCLSHQGAQQMAYRFKDFIKQVHKFVFVAQEAKPHSAMLRLIPKTSSMSLYLNDQIEYYAFVRDTQEEEATGMLGVFEQIAKKPVKMLEASLDDWGHALEQDSAARKAELSHQMLAMLGFSAKSD